MTALTIGSPAPDFVLAGTGGAQIHLADFRGKQQVVLAFYPKDMSGG